MTTVSRIFKNAGIVKSSVLNQHKLGAGEQWGFVFAKEILSPGKAVPGTHCKKASNPRGQEWKGNVTREEYTAMAKQLVTFVNKNDKMPDYLSFERKGKSIKLETKVYVYLFARIVRYYEVKKKLPKEMVLDTSVFKQPTKKYGHATSYGCDNKGQNNSVFCGPHSMQECIRNLTGKVISQSTLASWAGTGSGGTDHYGIETAIAMAAKQLGVNLSCKWYNFSDLGWNGIRKIVNSNNQDCIIHNLYRNQWGHYEVVNKVYDDYCDVQNSLGDSCSSGCYCGYVEERYLSTFRTYIGGISQKSVLVVTMEG